MATHCQATVRNGSTECQDIGAVDSFEGKKGAVNFKLGTCLRIVTCKMCLLSLYVMMYIYHMKHFMEKNWSHICI